MVQADMRPSLLSGWDHCKNLVIGPSASRKTLLQCVLPASESHLSKMQTWSFHPLLQVLLGFLTVWKLKSKWPSEQRRSCTASVSSFLSCHPQFSPHTSLSQSHALVSPWLWHRPSFLTRKPLLWLKQHSGEWHRLWSQYARIQILAQLYN